MDSNLTPSRPPSRTALPSHPPWRWLTQPTPAVRAPEARRAATLLLGLSLCLTLLLAALGLVLAVWGGVVSQQGTQAALVGSMAIGFVVSYALGRTRHWRAGALLLVSVTNGGLLLAVALMPVPGVMVVLLAMAVLLAGLFFSPLAGGALLVADAILVLLLARIVPDLDLIALLPSLGGFLVLGGVLVAERAMRAAGATSTASQDTPSSSFAYTTLKAPAVKKASRDTGGQSESPPGRIGEGLIHVDTEDVILYVNDAFCTMTGYRREELVGLAAHEVLLANVHGGVPPEGQEQTRLAGMQGQFEMALQRRSGEVILLLVTVSPLYNRGGKVIGSVSTQIDLTGRKWAEQALELRERERELLDQARLALARELNLTKVIISVVEGIAQTFGYALVSLYLVEGDQLVLQHQVGYDKVIGQLPLTQGVMGRVVRVGSPALIEDVGKDPDFVGAIDGIVSEICVPLFDQGRVVGVLSVESTRETPLGQGDMSLMMALSEHVGIAIERARLYTQARERARRLELISRIARGTAEIRDLDDLLTRAVMLIRTTFGFYSTTILLIDDRDLVLRAASLPNLQQMIGEYRLPVGEGSIVGWVAKYGEPVVVPDVSKDSRFLYFEFVSETRSEVAVPIRWKDDVIGVLNVESDKVDHFTLSDAHTLQSVADQLAIAIQNARLYQELEDYSVFLVQAVEERTAELQTAYEDLQKLSKVKDEFVAHVSHEMRTPIANLKLYHYLLESGAKERATYLATLNRETDRLHRIVEGVLQLSRLDQGQAALNLTRVDLNRVAEQYVVDRRPLARNQGLTLAFESDGDDPVVIADEALLGQALSTLLTNALNYTPEGGSVTVQTVHTSSLPGDLARGESETGRWAGFSISDTGIGIQPEDQPHLFERFFRGSAARDSGVPGTGLGLSIAQEIAERHGGRIEFESEGKGTTFTVWLPAGE